jgi:hypothetical protein
MAELRIEARAQSQRPTSRAGATAIILLWVAAAALVLWAFWPEQVS